MKYNFLDDELLSQVVKFLHFNISVFYFNSIRKMDQWLTEGLSKIFDFQVPDDMIEYILSIENENDLKEYMKTLLDFDNPHHKTFFLELAKRKFPGKGGGTTKQQKKKKGKQQDVVSPVEACPPIDADTKSKKKTKYVNLYSQEGKNAQVILLKGRHRCDCQASKHELINNCLQCGRVVCKQEGSGPCLFCGNLVCTPEERKELNSKTKAGAKLMESLLEKSRPEGWEAALSHRNRLLEYDRTSERRTHVTDDDSDYFNTNSVWLNSTERQKLQQYQQELHEKKHASRLQKKMTFDFAGRQIVEDTTIDYEVDHDQLRGSSAAGRSGPRAPHQLFAAAPDRDVAPGVNAPLLQFEPTIESRAYSSAVKADTGIHPRVQDGELLEMSDSGRCLSMHQPWASLLVEGIKLHEGRTWYTSHRGRLWIAATAKPPDHDVIAALENQYRLLYPEKQLNFPTFYPTGCLLGCVSVDDCLSQEEYQKKYPGGESDSPYVFICSNPISLRLRFPIKGQHKIYTLDKTIHQAAIKCIQKMSKIPIEEVTAG
ncbi:activating signal cointegrator 1 [Amyelois transitella]|uniref:activating signal cointegrator 1 n=1 Tax=Amyelois transitella TaxID=680683 RepID=UPI00067BDDB9|nr:activating signal cointegrator 1 [Amyelois transitella]